MPYVNMDEIKEQIFTESSFGEDKFLELHTINEADHEEGNGDSPLPPINEEASAELADLQRALEELQVDDWDKDTVSEDESE